MDHLKEKYGGNEPAEDLDQVPATDNEPVPSITVQVVLFHPDNNHMIYWVLNKEETDGALLPDYNTHKPRGWGNPGGSVEITDMMNDEKIHSFEDMILRCGERELKAETGFTDFIFERYLPSELPFLNQQNQRGHRVITLVARLIDVDNQVPVQEIEEIEHGAWIDLSASPVQLFKDHTDMPYWSHVRRMVIVFHRLVRQRAYQNVLLSLHHQWEVIAESYQSYQQLLHDAATEDDICRMRERDDTVTRGEEEYRRWTESNS